MHQFVSFLQKIKMPAVSKEQILCKIQKSPIQQNYLKQKREIFMKIRISTHKQEPLKQIDNRWSQIKMTHPFTARQAFAFCSQGDMGYLHGGYNSDEGIMQDMYMAKFNDPDDRSWHLIQQKGTVPGKLRYHTLVSYLCYLICVGGQKYQTQDSGELFCFNLKTQTWSKLNITSSDKNCSVNQIKSYLARDSHCSVINEKKMYIFGGYLLGKGQYSNDIVIIDLENIQKGHVTFRKIIIENQNKPKPRSNFASCAFQGGLYIFGGTDSNQFFDDLWRFDFEKEIWDNLTCPEEARRYWPQKRKGAVLIGFLQSQALILFGGMQTITRQQNDLSIYLLKKKEWVKIHSNTNNLYDPSPTLKNQAQTSPTIISLKQKHKQKEKQKGEFRIGLINASFDQSDGNLENTKINYSKSHSKPKSDFNNKVCKTQMSFTGPHAHDVGSTSKTQINFFSKKQSQHKMTVVQEKKYRQFLARKKRLLSQVYAGYRTDKTKRPFSPTSECLNYTLKQLGQQHEFQQSKNPEFHLPKVIFDDKKSQVIGKKPCARDGHAAFAVGKNMFIIGGDRHMVSFNDTHLLRMDKAIQSLSYYT